MTKLIDSILVKGLAGVNPYSFLINVGLSAAGLYNDGKGSKQAAKDLEKILSELSEIDSKISDGFAGKNVARGEKIRKLELEVIGLDSSINELTSKRNDPNWGKYLGEDINRPLPQSLKKVYMKEHQDEIDSKTLLLGKKVIELNDLKALQNAPAVNASQSSTPSATPTAAGAEDPRLAQLQALQDKIAEVIGAGGNGFVGLSKGLDDLKAKVGEFLDKLNEGIAHPKLNPGNDARGSVGGAVQQAAFVGGGVGSGVGSSAGVSSDKASAAVATLVAVGEGENPVEPAVEGVEKLGVAFADLGQQSTTIFEQMALSGDVSAKRLIGSFKQLAMSTLFQKLIPAMFGVSGGHIPGLATGGRANAGQPYIVGEKGPELMIPGSVGTIKPNLKGVGGNQANVTQNINFTTDVQNTVRAEVMNAAPHIVREASNAVIRTLRNPRYI